MAWLQQLTRKSIETGYESRYDLFVHSELGMRLIKKIWILVFVGACLGGTGFAQCHASIGTVDAGSNEAPTPIRSRRAGQHKREEDRTVLVELALHKSGGVREAKAIEGPTTLRKAAIRAIKRQRHKNWVVNVWPGNGWITAEVTFSQDSTASPEIHQVLPAGVSSCVPGGPIRTTPMPLLPSSMQPR